MLFELERSSLNDEEFSRRLAHLQAGHSCHLPQPVPVQPSQFLPPWEPAVVHPPVSRPPIGFQQFVSPPFQLPPLIQPNNSK